MFRRSAVVVSLLVILSSAVAAAPPQLDTSRTLAGIERFDGSPTAPPTTTGLWRQLVFELRRDQGPLTDRSPARSLQRRALEATARDVVPVGLIDTAFSDARDARTGRIFAATALRSAVNCGRKVTFALDPSWSYGAAPLDVEIDPGDGGGWRRVGHDGSDSRLEAFYPFPGETTVRLRATTDAGVRSASFPLTVAGAPAPAPDDTIQVTALVPYDGAVASGRAYVRFAPGRSTLQNPVVLVEGFDLDDTMDWDVLYELLNQEQMIETLLLDGFDAVVLDFDSATEPIQRNAMVLVELLAQVNAEIDSWRTSALVGASMGGLVARYALGWMEQQGIDPRVRTWISFDAPHRGAVIPLGLQHWLEFFQDDSESAAYLLSRLDTPAARQMLLQHHLSTSGTTAAADPLRAAFSADLAAVGLPSCRRVAAANGSGAALDQGFAPGQQIIRYEYDSLLLDLRGNVWALPDGGPVRIFQGVQNLIWPLPDTYTDVNVGGVPPWDNAPGGRRGSMAQMDTTSVPYGDIEALASHHAFIPTISALDLDVTDPFHDIAGDPALMSRTTFDDVYFPPVNEDHIAITQTSAAWLMAEIKAGVTAVEDAPTMAGGLKAWPNPFNAATTFLIDVETGGKTELEIFDLRGRLVVKLLDRTLEGGRLEVAWRAGAAVPSGTYLARLTTNTTTKTQHITLLE